MFDPKPDLPDDTPLATVRIPTILRNALHRAGLDSVGKVRAAQDKVLRRRRYIGPMSLALLRSTLGGGDR